MSERHRPYAVLVCGGRNYADKFRIDEVLSRVFYQRGASILIHGDAPGADRLASEWAQNLDGIQEIRCPAKWDVYGRKAGPIRNEQMLLLEPDLVVAFPGGRGTADMVSRARKAGIKVREVVP